MSGYLHDGVRCRRVIISIDGKVHTFISTDRLRQLGTGAGVLRSSSLSPSSWDA